MNTTTEASVAIRTSDRGQFKRCRVKWNFSSKLRLNYEYVPGVVPLDFGTAVHAGLEVYYDPKRWNDPARNVVRAEAIMAFIAHMDDWKKRLVKTQHWDGMKPTFDEHVELGKGMLDHYFLWAPKRDKAAHWTPVRVEIEFQIPINVFGHHDLMRHVHERCERVKFEETTGNLIYFDQTSDKWLPVYYEGRIDLLIQDEDGNYWIVDHKTAAQFGQTEHLELDQQCGSYVWALYKVLGIVVQGVIFNELRKKVPSEPTVLKSGALSQNKSQGTTVEIYKRALHYRGESVQAYRDFLGRLEASQQEFFRRNEVHRGEEELRDLERNIIMEAIDMLDDPFIYPNPDRWNCNGCQFRSPCLMQRDGSDWEWHMSNSGLYAPRAS